jgi:hypothetical protein
MLLYGTWGVGKTILSCRIGENPYLFITEPSDDSLGDWPDLSKRVTVTEYAGLNHLAMVSRAFKQGSLPHDTLIVDTLSELIEAQLDDIRDRWKGPKQTRPTFEPKEMGSGLPKREVNGTDDYRLVRDSLRPVINELCSLPMNVIFTAHEREPTWSDEAKLDKDGTPLPPIRPDLPGQTLKLVAKRVSLLGRMTRQGDSRIISFRTDNQSREEVKSRIRELDGQRLKDTEFLDIVNRWRNTK